MAKLPVFATVGLAFSDVVRATRAMPMLPVAAAIATVCYVLFGSLAPHDSEPGGLLAGLAYMLGAAILLAPIWIAVFRFIILKETTRRYVLDIRSRHFQAFCAWYFFFFVVADFPSSLVSVYTKGDPQVALWLSSHIFAFLFLPVLALILPAAAIGAQGMSARNAIADIQGSFWRAVAIQTLIYFPFAAVALIADAISESWMVRNAVYAPLWFCAELIWNAATARMFLVLANRLRPFVSA